MMKIITYIILLCVLSGNVFARALNINQILSRTLNYQPSLKIALLELESLQEEDKKIRSRLSWQLNVAAGMRHDVSLFGSANDILKVDTRLARQLASGETLAMSAAVSYIRADVSLSPNFPNPSTSTQFDISYRMPLQKGKGNPVYHQAIADTESIIKMQKSGLVLQADYLAEQLVDLYYALAVNNAHLKNTQQSIKRTQRLRAYIDGRTQFGIAEDKDVLQVDAQLKLQSAQQKVLNLLINQQTIALNRLMGDAWDASIDLQMDNAKTGSIEYQKVLQKVVQYSPLLKQLAMELKQVEGRLALRRDARKDQLDLILFAGDRDLRGDLASSSYDENELVGGVRLEFKRSVDRSGYDAEIYQAQLQRGMVLQKKQLHLDAIKYKLAALLQKRKDSMNTLEAYRASLQTEQEKLQDAQQRYRDGRADLDQIIAFENQLSAIELLVSSQQLDVARLFTRVRIMYGDLWRDVSLPSYLSFMHEVGL